MTKQLVTKHTWLGSSANPEELSMTVKGLLVSLVPLLMVVLKATGVDIDESTVLEVINQFTTALAAVLVGFGAARKFYFYVKNKFFA